MSLNSENYVQFTNPSKIRFSSQKSWENGMQRRLLANNEIDPFDNFLSVSQGERRKIFIDGYGRCFHSGDRSRINIRANAYNQLINFNTKWKTTGLTNLSLRLRSRIDEATPDTNRFGGYVAVITSSQIAWYKENYSGNYTSLSPATTTITPALTNNEELYVKFYCYSNLANTQTILEVRIARPHQYKLIGTSTDTSPASHVLNQNLYYNRSFAHIKLNGTAKDMMYRYLQVWDLGNEYYKRAYDKYTKGIVVKSVMLKFNMTNMVKTLTTRFNINYA